MNLPAHSCAGVPRNKVHATNAWIHAVVLADNLSCICTAGGNPGGGVVVDSEPGEWLGCNSKPSVIHKRPVGNQGRSLHHVLGKAPPSQEVQKDTVLQSIDQLSLLGDILVLGNDGREVQDKPRVLNSRSFEGLDAVPTGDHEAIEHLQACRGILLTRSMNARGIAEEC